MTKQPHRYPAGLNSLWDSGPEKTSSPETSERSQHWPAREDACLDHRGAALAFPAPTLPCVSEASQLGPLSLVTRLEMVTLRGFSAEKTLECGCSLASGRGGGESSCHPCLDPASPAPSFTPGRTKGQEFVPTCRAGTRLHVASLGPVHPPSIVLFILGSALDTQAFLMAAEKTRAVQHVLNPLSCSLSLLQTVR